MILIIPDITILCVVEHRASYFKNNCIHVRGQLVRYGDMAYHYEPTKTAKGMRDIPMTPEVAQCFENMWKNHRNRELDAITKYYAACALPYVLF